MSNGFVPGLAGVIAAQSAISTIDGDNGILRYRGILIEELAAQSTFEETAYLLLYGQLPTADQLSAFDARLRGLRGVPDALIAILRTLPAATHPMVALQTCVCALGGFYPHFEVSDQGGNDAAVVRLIACFPTIVAAFDRIRKGRAVVSPDASLTHAANYLYMLNGERPDETQTRIIDVALILHAEHGFNASTFSTRVVGSSEANPFSSVAAGVGSLSGPLHGRANEEVLHMLNGIEGGLDGVEAFFNESVETKRLIMGLGHRIYKVKDPRAHELQRLARDLFAQHGSTPLYAMAHKLEQLAAAHPRFGGRGIAPNVDFYSGLVYQKIGMEEDLFTPFFAIARIAGWGAHYCEQLADNRIFRPTQEYTGVVEARYTPLAAR
ncbi:MAG: citrate synthase [Deltaproteobacteria bacterium]|nr:citrate synthase [Deltaproteobacteria bacterium]